MTNSSGRVTRRYFLGTSALAATALTIGSCVHRSARRVSPNDKLNIGFIGAGGRANDNIAALTQENVYALCDVDEKNAAANFAKYPQAKRYRDFREMLDKEKSLNAIVVSTPDHMHAFAAITAMQHGKHVYCEKPLAHSIYEARRMRQIAAQTKVVTQMGQQGHAMEGSRQAVEVIRSGALGEVRELHVWTDRPAGWWPQGVDRPTETPPVPETLDWDLWLGPAKWRPYHPIYVPFKWRGRWDFGTGAIGDMGVHNLDTAFWALELGVPTSARVVDSGRATADCPPEWSILELQFPAGKRHGPLKLTWYDGKKLPPAELFYGEKITGNGSLVVGSKGTLFTRDWHGGANRKDMFMLLPTKSFEGYVPPPQTLPRTKEHHIEWADACRGGPKTESSFAYASVLTEALLVGVLALRTGKQIEWDAKNMRAKNCPEADPFIHPEFRQGWTI
jgi:predicted dehydrogenase